MSVLAPQTSPQHWPVPAHLKDNRHVMAEATVMTAPTLLTNPTGSADLKSEGDTVTGETIAVKKEAAEEAKVPTRLMLFLLCAVSALEGADTALLPAAMLALQKDVGLKFTDLAYLNVAEAVCVNLAAPLWGILADRGAVSRRKILIIGSLGQGAVTVMLSVITALGPMVFLRALNGIMLSALRPISNGIIADSTSSSQQGKIFGRVQASLLLGMFVTTLTAVPMANKEIWNIQGWRVAFVLIGSLSVVVSGLVGCFFVEPPRPQGAEGAGPAKKGFGVVLEEILMLLRFLRIPSFGVMIMQGIFGTIPWSVMGNMTLFFQLSGQSDTSAAVLSAEGTVAGVFGNLLGGMVADALSRRFGLHGRPLNAQITVAIGIPIIYLIFMGIPPGEGSFAGYFLLIAGFGILGSWAQSGTNFPVLASIVPANSRSKVMAWECALENSIANALGPPVVAFLATKCFGYKFGEEEKSGKSIASAEALGQAMTAVICFPWLICFCAYSLLHWSYPRDIRRLQKKQQQQEAEAVELKLRASASSSSSISSSVHQLSPKVAGMDEAVITSI
mmetsp:Transcript_26017/g.56783  ORF Transcript_26017/g.56783 Transcript_26017/m.56783 type:complete len:560 (+) Transcript_26017:38-1717(+)